jgi:1-acyl-sn-glycerol-3-phosphate acyltransferase
MRIIGLFKLLVIAIAIFIFLVFTLPAYFVFWLIGRKDEYRRAVLAQGLIKWIFSVIMWLAGARITCAGLENIPRDKACLFVSNHRSLVDVCVGYATLPVPTGFVAKIQTKKYPVFSWWMNTMHCIYLDRGNIKQEFKSMLHGIDNIKNGYSMFIMPEGHRYHLGEVQPFKEGSLKLAEKSGSTIIPVSIINSDALFEAQLPFVKSCRVIIHYGEPIVLGDLPAETRKFLGAHVRGVISDMIEQDEQTYGVTNSYIREPERIAERE